MSHCLEHSPVKHISNANTSVGRDFISKLKYDDSSLSEVSLEFARESRLSGELLNRQALKDDIDMGSPIIPRNSEPRPSTAAKRRLQMSEENISTLEDEAQEIPSISTLGSSEISSFGSLTDSVHVFQPRYSQESQPLSQLRANSLNQKPQPPSSLTLSKDSPSSTSSPSLPSSTSPKEEESTKEAPVVDKSRLKNIHKLRQQAPSNLISPRKRLSSGVSRSNSEPSDESPEEFKKTEWKKEKQWELEKMGLQAQVSKLTQTEKYLRQTIDNMTVTLEKERVRFDDQLSKLMEENARLREENKNFSIILAQEKQITGKLEIDVEHLKSQMNIKERELLAVITSLNMSSQPSNQIKEESTRPSSFNHQSNASKRIRELENKLAAANSKNQTLEKKVKSQSHPRIISNIHKPSRSNLREIHESPVEKISVAVEAIEHFPIPSQSINQIPDDSLIVKRLREEIEDLTLKLNTQIEWSSRRCKTLEQGVAERDADIEGLRSKNSALNTHIKSLLDQLGGQTAENVRDFRIFELKNEERLMTIKDHYCEEIRRIRTEHNKVLSEMEKTAEESYSDQSQQLLEVKRRLRDAQLQKAKFEQRNLELENSLEILKANPVVSSIFLFLEKLENVENSLKSEDGCLKSQVSLLESENTQLQVSLASKNLELIELRKGKAVDIS
ncbi:hypothetical protein GEMRC1_010541 [Eukaryota sp. GEM-RC1]